MFEGKPDDLRRGERNPPAGGLVEIVGDRGGGRAGLRDPCRESAHAELRGEGQPDRGVLGGQDRTEGQEFAGVHAPIEIRGPRRGNPGQNVLHGHPATGGSGVKLKRFPAEVGEPDMAEIPVPVARAQPTERRALGNLQPAADGLSLADGVEQAPGELPALDAGARPVLFPLEPEFPDSFASPAALLFPLPPENPGRVSRLRSEQAIQPIPEPGFREALRRCNVNHTSQFHDPIPRAGGSRSTSDILTV